MADSYESDRALLDDWGARLLTGQVVPTGDELQAHLAGLGAGFCGASAAERSRTMDALTSARQRVAFVVGYGRGRALFEGRGAPPPGGA